MSDSEIATWLISNCGMGASKAAIVAERLYAELWVDRVEALQTIVMGNSDSLDHFEFPKPMLAIIKSKILSLHNRNIVDLSTHDVQHLLLRLYPGEQYGETFRRNRINGFVLSSAGSVEKIAEWGISLPIHAETLWSNVTSWKAQGVPSHLLAREDQESMTTDSSMVMQMKNNT